MNNTEGVVSVAEAICEARRKAVFLVSKRTNSGVRRQVSHTCSFNLMGIQENDFNLPFAAIHERLLREFLLQPPRTSLVYSTYADFMVIQSFRIYGKPPVDARVRVK